MISKRAFVSVLVSLPFASLFGGKSEVVLKPFTADFKVVEYEVKNIDNGYFVVCENGHRIYKLDLGYGMDAFGFLEKLGSEDLDFCNHCEAAWFARGKKFDSIQIVYRNESQQQKVELPFRIASKGGRGIHALS